MSRTRSIVIFLVLCLIGGGVYFAYERAKTPPYVVRGKVDVHKAIQYWEGRIDAIGPAMAHEEMVAQGESVAQKHTLAHAFGEALYSVNDLNAIRHCGAGEYLYGCYHQFIGLAALQYGVSVVKELKNTCGDQNGDTQCAHGIGHGILAALGYQEPDVMRSLSLCRSLYDTGSAQGACADGVFMEYNLQEMTELDQIGALDRIPRPYTEDDAYQPCLRLSYFQAECVYEQPLWWTFALLETGLDHDATWAKMGELCRTLSPSKAMERTCFAGIGFPIAQLVRFDISKIRAACALAGTGDEQTQCLSGAARRFVENNLPHSDTCEQLGLAGESATYCKKFSTGPRDTSIRGSIPFPSTR